LNEANRLLERLLSFARSAGRNGRAIEILILLALTCQAQGATAPALDALGRALLLAEPEGYVRVFVDEGEPMRLLISDFRVRMAHPVKSEHLLIYADKLLAACAQPELNQDQLPARNLKSTLQNLPDPLTKRELQILRLIADGRSYQDIARELVIAFSTVQSYIRRIYSKLDVHSGLEAAARARELGLL
jgi:LuxR family maltose regulon positive regulatory protein